MSIPPNQFRRDYPQTHFVLLDSSAGPVASKSNTLINVILKKNPAMHMQNTETSTNDILRCLTGQVDKLVDFGCISTGRSVYTLI